MEFPDDRCNGWKLWMSKLPSELRLTVTCHMCREQWLCRDTSWYVPLTLFFDRYHLRETPFFRDRSDPEGRRYRTKEAKQKMKEKKKKERAIKDHKNDWLADSTRLKLVMKNKWTSTPGQEEPEESGFTCLVYLRDHLKLVVKPAPMIPHFGRGENCCMAHAKGHINVDLY